MSERIISKTNALKILPPRLQEGECAVIPTDTVYGIVACVTAPQGVKRVYKLKGRDYEKQAIVLVDDPARLHEFGVVFLDGTADILDEVWPGPVSIVLPIRDDSFRHLHPSTETLAFREPQGEWLRALLETTGPIIAPSANPQGGKPATTLNEAVDYFSDTVPYVDGGTCDNLPSTLIDLTVSPGVIIREGSGAEHVKKVLKTHF